MTPARHTKSFPFSVIIISVFLACYHVAKKYIIFLSFCGGARPKMLNMPKSAFVNNVVYSTTLGNLVAVLITHDDYSTKCHFIAFQ